jgi:hypothetical protein
MIYIGQSVLIETTFTEAGAAVDISGGTVTFDYWVPGNSTSTPDGTITGTIVDATAGEAEGEIDGALTVTPGLYRVQSIITLSGDSYRGTTTGFTVYPLGV